MDQNKNEEYKLKPAPLLCWDIFIDGYYKMMHSAEDLNVLNKLGQKQKWQHSFNFKEQILKAGNTILVTDLAIQIVYASSNIYAMNGYEPGEIIGKSPKMFQGKDTSETTRIYIWKAIKEYLPFETDILNYRKNGLPYNCHIKGFPLFNLKKEAVNFIAFENIA